VKAIEISDELYARAERAAAEKGSSVSEYVAEVLEAYLAQFVPASQGTQSSIREGSSLDRS
jgi:predicted DNA-binding protein